MPISKTQLSPFIKNIIPYLILIGLISLSWLVLKTVPFILTGLQCNQTEAQTCSPAMAQYFAPHLNHSILTLDAQSILNQAPIFTSGERLDSLRLIFPSTLSLATSLPEPDLVLTRVDTGQSIVLSAESLVISVLPSPPPDIPRVILAVLPPATVNEPLHDPVLSDLHRLISLLRSVNLKTDTINLEQLPTIAVQLKPGPAVLFTRSADLSLAVASLQLILASPTINPEEIGVIDLRFGKPILKPHQ